MKISHEQKTEIERIIRVCMQHEGMLPKKDHDRIVEIRRQVAFDATSAIADFLEGYRSADTFMPETFERSVSWTYDEEGQPVCCDPVGHSWVVRDDNEEIAYCENCGVGES